MTVPDWSWMDDSPCKDMDPEMFHPPGKNISALDRFNTKAALNVCRTECPVRQECLTEDFRMGVTKGIRGGFEERERRKMLADHRAQRGRPAVEA